MCKWRVPLWHNAYRVCNALLVVAPLCTNESPLFHPCYCWSSNLLPPPSKISPEIVLIGSNDWSKWSFPSRALSSRLVECKASATRANMLGANASILHWRNVCTQPSEHLRQWKCSHSRPSIFAGERNPLPLLPQLACSILATCLIVKPCRSNSHTRLGWAEMSQHLELISTISSNMSYVAPPPCQKFFFHINLSVSLTDE